MIYDQLPVCSALDARALAHHTPLAMVVPDQRLDRVLFTGAGPSLADYALVHALQQLRQPAGTVWVMDCANVFDPYLVVRCAQVSGAAGDQWLRRVRTVRAFTPYQTLTLLEQSARRTDWTGQDQVLVCLPYSGLEDSGFSTRERMFLARRITGGLEALSRHPAGGCWVVAHPPVEQLGECLQRLARALPTRVHCTPPDSASSGPPADRYVGYTVQLPGLPAAH